MTKFCNVLHVLLLQCSLWLFAFFWADGIKKMLTHMN